MNTEIEDLKTIMSSKHGRRYINRQIETCGVYQANTTIGPEAAWNEGMRNYGLRLVGQIKEHCFESFLLMQQEAHNEKQVRAQGERRKQQQHNND